MTIATCPLCHQPAPSFVRHLFDLVCKKCKAEMEKAK